MESNNINFSKSALISLNIYVDLLVKWQNKINLVSKNSLNDLWKRHIHDSAQLYSLLPVASEESYIYDLGSGAGFPGMVLAIMGRKEIVLCEPNSKKYVFLRKVAETTSTNVNIVNIKAHRLPKNSALAVISRAFASLEKLLDLSLPLLKENGVCIFPKGKTWKKEIKDAEEKYFLDYKSIISKTSQESAIIIINKAEKKYV